ncbi:hypothetical protein HJD18_06785 [Thermoleophilia bacterium SCSIO 60948]|nr:hypothetical protein HJD18_06785 [Thermoleophilia bacterium SCSIO 60948]
MSVEVERFRVPRTAGQVRSFDRACARMDDRLAGHTIRMTLKPARGDDIEKVLMRVRPRPGDVVVVRGRPDAELTAAIRDCGGHAVWQLTATLASLARVLSIDRVLADACVAGAPQRFGPGLVGERVIAVVPACGLVADKVLDPQIRARWRELGWDSALADAISADRHDRVGGTLRVRPTVAVR